MIDGYSLLESGLGGLKTAAVSHDVARREPLSFEAALRLGPRTAQSETMAYVALVPTLAGLSSAGTSILCVQED